jgi:hypothetical protein
MCSDSKGIVPLCGALRGRHDGDDVREAAVGADLSSGDVAPYTRATVEDVTLYGGVLGRERLAGQGPARAWRRRGPGRGHGSVRTLRSIADQLGHRDMQALYVRQVTERTSAAGSEVARLVNGGSSSQGASSGDRVYQRAGSEVPVRRQHRLVAGVVAARQSPPPRRTTTFRNSLFGVLSRSHFVINKINMWNIYL